MAPTLFGRKNGHGHACVDANQAEKRTYQTRRCLFHSAVTDAWANGSTLLWKPGISSG